MSMDGLEFGRQQDFLMVITNSKQWPLILGAIASEVPRSQSPFEING